LKSGSTTHRGDAVDKKQWAIFCELGDFFYRMKHGGRSLAGLDHYALNIGGGLELPLDVSNFDRLAPLDFHLHRV